MEAYRVERISEANTIDLVALYRHVFNRKVTQEFLLRKFETKIPGVKNIGFIAYSKNNKAVAYYGVLPCWFKTGDRILLAAQSADTMTHPEHRHRQLFMLLAGKTYDLARQHNIQFIFGFPNQNSLPGFIKLNWTFSDEKLKFFRIKTGMFPFAKIAYKSRPLRGIYNSYARSVLSGYFAMSRKVNSCDSGVLRDAEFIRYKTYSETYHLEIDGLYLWLKIDGVFRIGYVGVPDDYDPKLSFKRLRKLARKLGCAEILFITSGESPGFNYFKEFASSEDSFAPGFLNLSGTETGFGKISFDYCDIDTF